MSANTFNADYRRGVRGGERKSEMLLDPRGAVAMTFVRRKLVRSMKILYGDAMQVRYALDYMARHGSNL